MKVAAVYMVHKRDVRSGVDRSGVLSKQWIFVGVNQRRSHSFEGLIDSDSWSGSSTSSTTSSSEGFGRLAEDRSLGRNHGFSPNEVIQDIQ